MLSQRITKWRPTITTRIDIKEDNGSHNITAKVGNFGEIKSQQLRNEAGRAMTVQGAGFASMFQFENDVLTLAPSVPSGPIQTRPTLRSQLGQGQ